MSGTTGDRRTVIREQIVYNLLELDDEYYRKWVSDFYGRGQTFTTIADTAAPTLSAASAVTTGGASTVLALISSGVGTLNTAVSKNFLQQSAISLLTARSDALRDNIRAGIYNRMTNSVAIYPLGMALLDIQDYARAGSLPAAAQAIQGDTSAQKSVARTNTDKAILTPAIAAAVAHPPGPPSAANSVIKISPNPIKDDGISPAIITVTTKDSQNVAETTSSGAAAVVLVPPPNVTISPVTDHNNGIYTATVTSTSTGSFIINGTLLGNPIGHSDTITVTAH